MSENANNIPQKPKPIRPLDDFDRKILGALTKDARLSYAEIGKQVALSAPAVHERVKRLIASGTIKYMAAQLDGPRLGKPFLAFVQIISEVWNRGEQMMRLKDMPEVEEMHSTAGDACFLLKVRTEDAAAMESFLENVYSIPGVKGTKTNVVLSTFLERPVQAEITQNW
jgi:DNA-binding Lrp family transcriptional regulator